jgi:prevent-host-death family protein
LPNNFVATHDIKMYICFISHIMDGEITMQSTTFTEFRNNAKRFFDRVEKGESIEIYRHGMPVAILMPVQKRDKSRLMAARPLKLPGVSLSKALLAERKEK